MPAQPYVPPKDPAIERDIAARLRAAGCVFAEDEARLLLAEATDPDELVAWIARRVAGEPLEIIVGWAQFAGLRIAVAPGVFVPRRRTELLARAAIRLVRDARPGPAVGRGERHVGVAGLRDEHALGAPSPVLVELCCGAAAVSVVVARDAAPVELYAVDVDPAAVACAERNLAGLGAVFRGDLVRPLPRRLRGRVDVLAANAPYVPSAEIAVMPREARDREPRVALDGGVDGLEIQHRIARLAPVWLRPGGHLLVETSERQAAGTADLMTAAGLMPRVLRDPEIGAIVVAGAKPDA